MLALAQAATTEAPPAQAAIQVAASGLASAKLLFTYGTLMRGQSRNYIISHELYEGEAYIENATLYATPYGFPALLMEGTDRVWGEVWRIRHAPIWALLDQIEAGLYTRETKMVHIPSKSVAGRHVPAEVYVAKPGYLSAIFTKKIDSGRWQEHADAQTSSRN